MSQRSVETERDYMYIHAYTSNFSFQMTADYKLVVFLYQLSLFCLVLDCSQEES